MLLLYLLEDHWQGTLGTSLPKLNPTTRYSIAQSILIYCTFLLHLASWLSSPLLSGTGTECETSSYLAACLCKQTCREL